MRFIDRGKLGPVALDGTDDRGAKVADDRIDPAEQGPVCLRSPANGLVEILALRDVESAKRLGNRLQRWKIFGEVGDVDQPLIAFQPLAPRISRKPPGRRRISPKLGCLVTLEFPVDQPHGFRNLAHPQQMADAPLAKGVIDPFGELTEKLRWLGLRIDFGRMDAFIDRELRRADAGRLGAGYDFPERFVGRASKLHVEQCFPEGLCLREALQRLVQR